MEFYFFSPTVNLQKCFCGACSFCKRIQNHSGPTPSCSGEIQTIGNVKELLRSDLFSKIIWEVVFIFCLANRSCKLLDFAKTKLLGMRMRKISREGRGEHATSTPLRQIFSFSCYQSCLPDLEDTRLLFDCLKVTTNISRQHFSPISCGSPSPFSRPEGHLLSAVAICFKPNPAAYPLRILLIKQNNNKNKYKKPFWPRVQAPASLPMASPGGRMFCQNPTARPSGCCSNQSRDAIFALNSPD